MKTESILKLHNVHQAAAQAIRDGDIEQVKYIVKVAEDVLHEERFPHPGSLLTAQERDMLKSGFVINTIKSVRSRKNVAGQDRKEGEPYFGLKEAKEWVERAGDEMGLRINGMWTTFR